jgi:hypothetical protein
MKRPQPGECGSLPECAGSRSVTQQVGSDQEGPRHDAEGLPTVLIP